MIKLNVKFVRKEASHRTTYFTRKSNNEFKHFCFCGGQIKIIIRVLELIKHSPHSNCNFFYKFNLKSAKRVSARSPCTNRPFSCSICFETYWSYYLKQHYLEKHQQIDEVHQKMRKFSNISYFILYRILTLSSFIYIFYLFKIYHI